MKKFPIILFALILIAMAGCGNPTENDKTAPKIKITAPAAGAIVTDSVVVTIEADDDDAVARVLLMANQDTVAILDKAPWQKTLFLSKYPDGKLVLMAEAADKSKNVGKADPVEVEVRNVFQMSLINPLPTTTYVTVGNVFRVLAPGAAVNFSFVGNPGTVSYKAETYGVAYTTTATAGIRVGEAIQLSDTLDTKNVSGTLKVELAVPKEYFFAYLRNGGKAPLGPFIVNGGKAPNGTTDSVLVANDGVLHPLGYYKNIPGATIKAMQYLDAGAPVEWGGFNLPDTTNLSVFLTNPK